VDELRLPAKGNDKEIAHLEFKTALEVAVSRAERESFRLSLRIADHPAPQLPTSPFLYNVRITDHPPTDAPGLKNGAIVGDAGTPC